MGKAKVLLLPLLQLPSGHHQVADAVGQGLANRITGIQCDKVDILSYTSQWLEKMITGTYLKWIHHFPKSYEWIYRHYADPDRGNTNATFKLYENIFIWKLKELLSKQQPDLVICTHSFSSSLMSRLKLKGKTKVPVINIYTDFFINHIWGTVGIDYHFVPDTWHKEQLIEKHGLSPQRVAVTGIPVAGNFELVEQRQFTRPYNVVVSGGSNGLGRIGEFLQKTSAAAGIKYWVLCGKNQTLYDEISSWGKDYIKPLPYISSREEMDQLLDKADAIVTKPGGVTVSEALTKLLPIFVHSALPGQEEFNLEYLQSQGLVFRLKAADSTWEQQLLEVLESRWKLARWQKQVQSYRMRLEGSAVDKAAEILEKVRAAHISQGV